MCTRNFPTQNTYYINIPTNVHLCWNTFLCRSVQYVQLCTRRYVFKANSCKQSCLKSEKYAITIMSLFYLSSIKLSSTTDVDLFLNIMVEFWNAQWNKLFCIVRKLFEWLHTTITFFYVSLTLQWSVRRYYFSIIWLTLWKWAIYTISASPLPLTPPLIITTKLSFTI